MKKKYLAALALVLVFALPISASAAVTRAFVDAPIPNGSSLESIVHYYDGNSEVSSPSVMTSLTGLTSVPLAISAILASVATDAANRGYTLSNGVILTSLKSTDVQTMIDAAFANVANQANWTEGSSSAVGYVKNKPSLAAVATSGSYSDLSNKPTIGQAYEGTTQRTGAFPIFKSATVASGAAAFHLTADGTSGGAALCPSGVIQDSIDVEVNDAAASYQMSYAMSNANKTVTVTANKLTTANILTGILGQGQANGSVIRLVAWCY